MVETRSKKPVPSSMVVTNQQDEAERKAKEPVETVQVTPPSSPAPSTTATSATDLTTTTLAPQAVSSPVDRPKVLCLGMSYPCMEQQLKKYNVHLPTWLGGRSLVTAEDMIRAVQEKLVTEMDGRDMARCVATEQACNVDVYTVSQEKAAKYDETRHLHANFSRHGFIHQLYRAFAKDLEGNRPEDGGRRKTFDDNFAIRFRQIILDYFWIPQGWDVFHWAPFFFSEILIGLAKQWMFDMDDTEENSDVPCAVYLPFCFHCFRQVINAREQLKDYYAISFLRKEEMGELSLWKGTQTIDGVQMQARLAKQKNQEEMYCTFYYRDVMEAGTGPKDETKDVLIDYLSCLDDFDDIRFIKLRPLRQHDPTANIPRDQYEIGGLKGLKDPTKVKRGFRATAGQVDPPPGPPSIASERRKAQKKSSFPKTKSPGKKNAASPKHVVRAIDLGIQKPVNDTALIVASTADDSSAGAQKKTVAETPQRSRTRRASLRQSVIDEKPSVFERKCDPHTETTETESNNYRITTPSKIRTTRASSRQEIPTVVKALGSDTSSKVVQKNDSEEEKAVTEKKKTKNAPTCDPNEPLIDLTVRCSPEQPTDANKKEDSDKQIPGSAATAATAGTRKKRKTPALPETVPETECKRALNLGGHTKARSTRSSALSTVSTRRSSRGQVNFACLPEKAPRKRPAPKLTAQQQASASAMSPQKRQASSSLPPRPPNQPTIKKQQSSTPSMMAGRSVTPSPTTVVEEELDTITVTDKATSARRCLDLEGSKIDSVPDENPKNSKVDAEPTEVDAPGYIEWISHSHCDHEYLQEQFDIHIRDPVELLVHPELEKIVVYTPVEQTCHEAEASNEVSMPDAPETLEKSDNASDSKTVDTPALEVAKSAAASAYTRKDGGGRRKLRERKGATPRKHTSRAKGREYFYYQSGTIHRQRPKADPPGAKRGLFPEEAGESRLKASVFEAKEAAEECITKQRYQAAKTRPEPKFTEEAGESRLEASVFGAKGAAGESIKKQRYKAAKARPDSKSAVKRRTSSSAAKAPDDSDAKMESVMMTPKRQKRSQGIRDFSSPTGSVLESLERYCDNFTAGRVLESLGRFDRSKDNLRRSGRRKSC